MAGRAQSLASQVILRVLPPASVVLLAIWYIASETTTRTVEQQVRERLNLVALQSAESLSARLGAIQEAVRGIAANDLIVNGVVDAAERDDYFFVLFRSFRIPGPDGAVITLTDHRGRPISSTGDILRPVGVAWLSQVMDGQNYFEITPQGALMATPVIHAGAPEGAVVISYDAARVPAVLHVSGDADATLVVRKSNGVLYSSLDQSGAFGTDIAALEAEGWLLARAAVAGFPHLTVVSALEKSNASAAVNGVRSMMLVAVLCSIGALGGGIVLAAFLATRPLSDFIGSIGEITHATDLRRRITSKGPAEFRDLAVSFNQMIERLERTTTSRDKFDNIVNSMLEMLIVTDSQGEVTFANRAARHTFGLDRRNRPRPHILDLFEERGGEAGWSRLAPGNIDENSRSIEAVCRLSGDKLIHVLVTASRATGSESAGPIVIYVALDVTESKTANDALFQAKQQLQTAIESISEGFTLYDSNDRLTVFNSKYQEVYSDTADIIETGANFEDIIRTRAERGQYPDALGRIDAFVKERLALHRNPSGPFEQKMPNGQWLRIEERLTTDGGIVGIRLDITELKRREEELLNQAGALEQSNALLERENKVRMATEVSLRDSEMRTRAVFETAADGVITIDPKGVVGDINPAAERIFDYRAGELVGANFWHCMAESRQDERDSPVAGLLASTKLDAGAGGSTREMMGLRKDGRVFPMELTISSVPLGARREFTVIVRDISERKKIENMKDEFISTVSHELRTPLTAINGTIGLLRSGAAGDLPDPANKLIKIAFENCRRLGNLINDILDVEKIASDALHCKMKSLALPKLIEDAVEVNSGLATAAKVRLVAQKPLPEVVVKGDFNRLSQVLTNLISNAVKHSPTDGVVGVAAELQGGLARVSVIDRGSGVPHKFRDKIFRRFSQADASDTRGSGGAGLGLAICKSIIEQHDGAIGFVSEPDKRTEFHFTLQLWDPAKAAPASIAGV